MLLICSIAQNGLICPDILEDRFTVFQVCFKTIVNSVLENTETGLICFNHSSLPYGIAIEVKVESAALVLCKNMFEGLSEAAMRLQLSELIKSSTRFPKLQSFLGKIVNFLCSHCVTVDLKQFST